MRDASTLKRVNAKVYYRDRLGKSGPFEYVEGVVLEIKSVKEAKRDWQQDWNRKVGTILKIAPKDNRVFEYERARYRHLSSVLTPEQHTYKNSGRRTKRRRSS